MHGPGRRPSRAASRPPQGDGSEISNFVLAARFSARAIPRHSREPSPPNSTRCSVAKLQQANAGGSVCKRGFGTDDGKKERKERNNERKIGGETPTDARSSSAAPCGCGRCPGGGSTTIGVPPRFSSRGVFHLLGTQHQARLPATWRGHVLRIPLSGRYPPLPVPVQRRTSRSGHNAGEMMPDAARERVASPPAGFALARAIRLCLPKSVRTGRDSEGYVIETGTIVNGTVTLFRHGRVCP